MVSEIDIRDWEQGEPTKLYNIPPKTYFEEVWSGKIFQLDYVFGSQAYCLDLAGTQFEISAYSDIVPLKERN